MSIKKNKNETRIWWGLCGKRFINVSKQIKVGMRESTLIIKHYMNPNRQ